MRNSTTFHISGLNQEKVLGEIAKSVHLFDVDRTSKSETTFKCSFFDYRQVEKILANRQVKIVEISHHGVLPFLKKWVTCWGAIAAIVVFFSLYLFQSQFVLKYQVLGVENLSETEVVQFVKQNFSNVKRDIDTKSVENSLISNFKEISFASCIIKGQTLVVNIKEKLMPNEMYGEFAPIYAQNDGRITQIDLISGTLKVKVGDFVRKGDVLVEPFTLDTAGNLKKVEAKANILAQVFHEGTEEHYETVVKTQRTGKVAVRNEITLFGLKIYSYVEQHDFKMYETETEQKSLIKNLLLPFKIEKTWIYELEQITIVSKFEDVEDEIVAKAREKALEKVEDCDKIKEEYFSVRHLPSMSVVKYEIVTEQEIGGTNDSGREDVSI